MNADDFDIYEFGIDRQGNWGGDGMPKNWTINYQRLGDALPRWLLKEPVMTLNEKPMCCVYLRGCYSEKLTFARRQAIIAEHGASGLLPNTDAQGRR